MSVFLKKGKFAFYVGPLIYFRELRPTNP